jgi:hypothetical protein
MMPSIALRISFGAAAALASMTLAPSAFSAPSPPHGSHPRLFLTAPTMAALKAKVGVSGSAAARVVEHCKSSLAKPSDFQRNDNWEWSFVTASCAMAFQLTGDPAMAAQGIKFWNALMDDYESLGDGAGGDTVIQHDGGYYIREHGPYAALAYDWLHDAPGVDDALRAKARGRFKAWVDWYADQGYLKDTAGSNYHAGYVFAKALIAVAAAGEDGGVSDAYFAQVSDVHLGKEIIKGGLAKTGVLTGSDWPEGWQYGPLSVLEYALTARAIEEHGGSFPEMHAWASDLTLDYLYAVPPNKSGVFTDGDVDNDQPVALLNARTLIATMAGLGSDQAAGFASSFRASPAVTLHEDCAVFDALAEARGAAPVDMETTKPSLYYVAPGTRKLYARSKWNDKAATWAFFTAAPRLVPDHQHVDASNFAFVRGADWLIADPSPYGSLSSLTSNTLTVDSNTIEAQDKPSQSVWENASELLWARGATSGIAAARADLSGAFAGTNGTKSDVPFARRDWVFLPEGDVVVLDRARTDDSSRKMHVRFRTTANLALSSSAPYVANGGVGGSALFIHAVKLSDGAPQLRKVVGNGTCDGIPYGKCEASRFPVTEYFVDVPGPNPVAIHVMDGLGPSDQGPIVAAMNDSSIEATPGQNDAVVGALVRRGGLATFVVASSGKDGIAGASMTYVVPGDAASRQVVFDAPEDASGKSSVTTASKDGHCTITINAAKPGAGVAFEGHPLMFGVSKASDGCKTTEDVAVAPGSVVGGGGAAGNGDHGGAASGGGSDDSGCGCGLVGSGAPLPSWLGVVGIGSAMLTAVGVSRRRRRRRATPAVSRR